MTSEAVIVARILSLPPKPGQMSQSIVPYRLISSSSSSSAGNKQCLGHEETRNEGAAAAAAAGEFFPPYLIRRRRLRRGAKTTKASHHSKYAGISETVHGRAGAASGNVSKNFAPRSRGEKASQQFMKIRHSADRAGNSARARLA